MSTVYLSISHKSHDLIKHQQSAACQTHRPLNLEIHVCYPHWSRDNARTIDKRDLLSGTTYDYTWICNEANWMQLTSFINFGNGPILLFEDSHLGVSHWKPVEMRLATKEC
jgi:hypothetical protein